MEFSEGAAASSHRIVRHIHNRPGFAIVNGLRNARSRVCDLAWYSTNVEPLAEWPSREAHELIRRARDVNYLRANSLIIHRRENRSQLS